MPTFCIAAICWATWKKRNEACFENKLLRNPIDILIYACALMSYWAGLYGSDMQNKIMDAREAPSLLCQQSAGSTTTSAAADWAAAFSLGG